MGMGRWPGDRQREFWVAADGLASGPGHVFYDALNRLLGEADFDARVEELCAPFYAEGGRDSIPPGCYFRMLFVGYFEGLDAQRAIAWRCADSLSLRRFLGLGAEEESPDHSSLTRIRDRLPPAVHEAVFVLVLGIAQEKGLLSGRQVGVDSTLLEANAAMKSIVRRDTGEDWKDYLRRLAAEQGVEIKNDEDLRRFDLQRKKAGEKKVSNDEWTSPSDPDSRIVKMKDGRTHLGHKAEHVVDLQSEFILSATVCEGTAPDTDTLLPSLAAAEVNLIRAGSEEDIEEVAADKGYHSNAVLTDVKKCGIRTYIPERETGTRRWTDKSPDTKSAFHDNRRRVRRAKGKKLQRLRSERVERSFAHVCETGGARRTWLRGLEKINKRYQVHVAARNLGLVLRALFGFGTPRGLAARAAAAASAWIAHLAAAACRLARTIGRNLAPPPLRPAGSPRSLLAAA